MNRNDIHTAEAEQMDRRTLAEEILKASALDPDENVIILKRRDIAEFLARIIYEDGNHHEELDQMQCGMLLDHASDAIIDWIDNEDMIDGVRTIIDEFIQDESSLVCSWCAEYMLETPTQTPCGDRVHEDCLADHVANCNSTACMKEQERWEDTQEDQEFEGEEGDVISFAPDPDELSNTPPDFERAEDSHLESNFEDRISGGGE